jgi:hypothetical protein
MRNAFLTAAPFLTKTIKQQGCFFKVIVSQKDLNTLQFRIKSLPSNSNQQDLLVALPQDRSILFSKHEFANKIISQIHISLFGKASIG